jgi:hypothetical protein
MRPIARSAIGEHTASTQSTAQRVTEKIFVNGVSTGNPITFSPKNVQCKEPFRFTARCCYTRQQMHSKVHRHHHHPSMA